MAAPSGPIGRRVVAGAARIGAGRMVVRLIGVLSTLILARLLTPEDFGLVAVAMAFVGILDQMSEFGFNAALIRFQDADETDYATAWTLNLLRGLTVAAILVSLAVPAAHFYDDPRLTPLLGVLALMPLVSGLDNVRFIDFEKEMEFRPLTRVMVLVKLVAFAVTVSIAVATRSYWALIVGTLVAEASRVALTYWLKPFRPRPTLAAWRKLVGFSGWLFLANLLHALNNRSDVIVMQKILATQAVGLFYIAKDLARTPLQEVIAPVRRAFFPGLSQLGADSDDFRRAYFAVVAGLFMLLAPVAVGIALVADEAVPLLLGDGWEGAIDPIRIFALSVAVSVLGQPAISSVMASGRTRLWFVRNAIVFPIRFGLLIPAAIWGGLNGAVAAIFVSELVNTALNISMANRVIGSSFADHLKPCWRTLVSLVGLAVAVGAVDWVLAGSTPEGALGSALRLGVETGVGVVVYPVLHLGLWWAAGRPPGAESRVLELVAQHGPLRGRRSRA